MNLEDGGGRVVQGSWCFVVGFGQLRKVSYSYQVRRVQVIGFFFVFRGQFLCLVDGNGWGFQVLFGVRLCYFLQKFL